MRGGASARRDGLQRSMGEFVEAGKVYLAIRVYRYMHIDIDIDIDRHRF